MTVRRKNFSSDEGMLLQAALGRRIQELREEMKMSRESLALLCELSTPHMGRIEKGEQNPTLRTLVKVAKGLNISIEEVFRFRPDQRLSPERYSLMQYGDRFDRLPAEVRTELTKGIESLIRIAEQGIKHSGE